MLMLVNTYIKEMKLFNEILIQLEVLLQIKRIILTKKHPTHDRSSRSVNLIIRPRIKKESNSINPFYLVGSDFYRVNKRTDFKEVTLPLSITTYIVFISDKYS